MAIRKVLLPLTGDDADVAALTVAFRLAETHGALVEGVFLRFDQSFDRLSVPDRLPADLFDEVATLIAVADRREEEVRLHFEAAHQALGAADAVLGRAAARWAGSRPAQRLLRDARLADIVVIGRSRGEDRPLDALRGAVLATSGRPLLFAAGAAAGPKPAESVVVAWNGGASASRAVASALPMLQAAAAVHVVTVKTPKTRSGEAERLRDYLACHGIRATAAVYNAGDDPVGEVLLRRARGVDATLLVMGGKGQFRLTDLLFGGVTTHIFEHASIPVLIAQ